MTFLAWAGGLTAVAGALAALAFWLWRDTRRR